MPDPPLRIRELSHRYGDTPALRGVSFELAAGELLAVLGPSGCGKTTLLRSVAGLEVPSGGTIEVGGQVVSRDGQSCVPIERRGVGLVFQSYALFGHMSVEANVGFGLGRPDPERVRVLLERVGLSHFGQRKPAQLSGGQQQRVALARALAPRPHLLLLDEPFANVDSARRLELGNELRRILAAEGASALLVTHDQSDALRFADRVAVLVEGDEGGELAQCAASSAVYARPTSAAVAQLVGALSLLPAQANGTAAQAPGFDCELLEPREGPIQLALRPEQLRFEAGPGSAQVTSCAYLGRCFRLEVAVEQTRVWVDHPQPLAPGASGTLQAPAPVWALPG